MPVIHIDRMPLQDYLKSCLKTYSKEQVGESYPLRAPFGCITISLREYEMKRAIKRKFKVAPISMLNNLFLWQIRGENNLFNLVMGQLSDESGEVTAINLARSGGRAARWGT